MQKSIAEKPGSNVMQRSLGYDRTCVSSLLQMQVKEKDTSGAHVQWESNRACLPEHTGPRLLADRQFLKAGNITMETRLFDVTEIP